MREREWFRPRREPVPRAPGRAWFRLEPRVLLRGQVREFPGRLRDFLEPPREILTVQLVLPR